MVENGRVGLLSERGGKLKFRALNFFRNIEKIHIYMGWTPNISLSKKGYVKLQTKFKDITLDLEIKALHL